MSVYKLHGYKPITMTSYNSVMLYIWRHIHMEHDNFQL